MKKNLFLFSLLSFLLVLYSCDEYQDEVKTQHSVQGYAQKGPFISGGTVTIYELDQNLNPTGNIFSTDILDNLGTFSIADIPLDTTFVKLSAQGYYFNESSGKISDKQITLEAIVNLSESTSTNINIITHLEVPRVLQLFKNGKTFKEAKSQAQNEILSLFNINASSVNSEQLNMFGKYDDSGKLMAINAILLSYRAENDLPVLLSDIRADLQTDGKIDNPAIGSDLLKYVYYISADEISANLKNTFAKKITPLEIPDFKHYINQFITETEYSLLDTLISYPKTGSHGLNVLDPGIDTIAANGYRGIRHTYSLLADLKENTALKIVITKIPYDTIYNDDGTYTLKSVGTGELFWLFDQDSHWEWGLFSDRFQEFWVTQPGESDCEIGFGLGKYAIEYYEMNENLLTRKKIIRAVG
ncbi:hypothetical protein ACE1ET_00715 [Saccharicrinis sp. FJH62]|uniref:hypothetical protein n=1 Tax=Saccharicrinis sp. FJH62 TaxID=3344657 RepID=UPI0035D48321